MLGKTTVSALSGTGSQKVSKSVIFAKTKDVSSSIFNYVVKSAKMTLFSLLFTVFSQKVSFWPNPLGLDRGFGQKVSF